MEAWQLSTTALALCSAGPKSPSRSRTALSFILFSPFAFLLLHKMEALRLFCRVLLLSSLTGFLIRLSGLYEWKEIYEHKGEPEKEKNPFGTVAESSCFLLLLLLVSLFCHSNSSTTDDAVCSILDVLLLLFVCSKVSLQ